MQLVFTLYSTDAMFYPTVLFGIDRFISAENLCLWRVFGEQLLWSQNFIMPHLITVQLYATFSCVCWNDVGRL